MLRAAVAAIILVLTVCGTQCPIGDGTVCTEVFVYGVNVELTDEVTGQPISGATLVLTEGSFTETMMEIEDGEYVGAGERPGTYALSIEADGYASESRSGIVVTSDECHVIPVNLDIAPTPTP